MSHLTLTVSVNAGVPRNAAKLGIDVEFKLKNEEWEALPNGLCYTYGETEEPPEAEEEPSEAKRDAIGLAELRAYMEAKRAIERAAKYGSPLYALKAIIERLEQEGGKK